MTNDDPDQPMSAKSRMPMRSGGLDLVPVEHSVETSDQEREFINTAAQVFLQYECEPARAMLFDGGLNIQVKLARQLVEAHEAAMTFLDRGRAERNSVEAARLANVAVRLMTVFQQGVVALRNIQAGGERTTVQQVNVSGGNAVVAANVCIGAGATGASAEEKGK